MERGGLEMEPGAEDWTPRLKNGACPEADGWIPGAEEWSLEAKEWNPESGV